MRRFMQKINTYTQSAVTHEKDDEILDKHETARRLKISTRTLDAWMRARRVPFLKIGKTVRFRWSDVLEKLGESRVN